MRRFPHQSSQTGLTATGAMLTALGEHAECGWTINRSTNFAEHACSKPQAWHENRIVVSASSLRRGAALLEVLMAIGIMSIGVLSIMTLFPLSVRKALEASQKTNASILKWQFEQLLASNPQILPINDRTVHVPGDDSNNMFPSGTLLGTTRIKVVDPRASFTSVAPTGAPFATPTNPPTNDRFINGFYPGNNLANTTTWGTSTGTARKVRTHAALYPNEVENFTTLRDSWTSDVQFQPSGATVFAATTSTIPISLTGANLDTVTGLGDGASNGRYRIIISDNNGKQYQTRTNVFRNTASTLLTVSPPLPAAYTSPLVCRLQSFESRYSWMVTTKTTLVSYGPDNTSGTADDAVSTDAMLIVFFRRNLSELAETVTSGTFPAPPNSNVITIDKITAPPIPIEPGGYIFDAATGEWYLIISEDESLETPTTKTLTLDRPIIGTSPRDRLVIYKNIMGAYPLGRFWTGL